MKNAFLNCRHRGNEKEKTGKPVFSHFKGFTAPAALQDGDFCIPDPRSRL